MINAHKAGNKFIENLAQDIAGISPDYGLFRPKPEIYGEVCTMFPDGNLVQASLAQITWYHNIALMDKVKDTDVISGMQFKLQKTAGLAMCWFTKLKAACISDRRWQKNL